MEVAADVLPHPPGEFMLLFVVLACGTRVAQVPTQDHAVGASMVPLVEGESTRDEASGAQGLMTVHTQGVDQALSWEPAEGSLEAATRHEAGLVYQALDQPAPAEIALETVAVAGQGARSWEVDGGSTRFVGTSWHCAGQRLELTSYGADPEQVRATHQASLAGVTCGAD